jgi:hypothetical protein
VSPDAKTDVIASDAVLNCAAADASAEASYPIVIAGGALNTVAGANYRIAARVNGVLTISRTGTSVPPGGSLVGGGGGGGGSESAAPATVTAGGSVTIDFTRSGDSVTLEITDAKADEIIANSGATAAIDLSDMTGATTAVLPTAALSKFADADLAVEIKLPRGAVTLDAAAVKSLVSQAGGSDVSVGIKPVALSSLDARLQAPADATVFDISVLSAGSNVTSFGDGQLTVALSYTLKAGQKAAGIVVWRLDEGGNVRLPSAYDAGTKTVTFTTDHLSLYAIAYDAEAADAWVNPFTDVRATDWFFEDVEYAVTNGLFNGTSASTFSPNGAMTRGMIVTVLGRLAGADVNAYTASSFNDVAPGQYYAAYVEWAKDNGIVNGVGDGKFAPNAEVTRQDLATLLARYADFSGEQFPVTLQYATFADDASIADYAKRAVEILYTGGIVSGKPDNLFDPRGNATRAETAAMLHRYSNAVGR